MHYICPEAFVLNIFQSDKYLVSYEMRSGTHVDFHVK
jgi:hypothetical protein